MGNRANRKRIAISIEEGKPCFVKWRMNISTLLLNAN